MAIKNKEMSSKKQQQQQQHSIWIYLHTLTHMLKSKTHENKQTKQNDVRLKLYACSPLRQSRLWRVIHKFFMVVLDMHTQSHTIVYPINIYLLFDFCWNERDTEREREKKNEKRLKYDEKFG